MIDDVLAWWRWLAVGAAVLVVSWTALVLVARRLPPGLLRDLAAFLPDCLTAARRLRRDPTVPRRVKVAVAILAVWIISPIDLVPEFLPVIGPLDDLVVAVLVLRWAARRIPRANVLAAWPGEPRLLLRLLGDEREVPTGGRIPAPDTSTGEHP